MNIREAKQQIKNTMRAYFAKDEYGNFLLPVEEQRPIFLIGPPGIGKTAIVAEVASELGVGMLSYSMTHHTRQSALGLPMIETKIYDGREYKVTEYTMSEIIASIYDLMEDSGVKEGILFLDEINCVSETLTPAMLQFLQFKTFGKHAVPGGWLVVTAGNPPEYNRNVREFDTVTWDRLKRIDVEPDFGVWKDYALEMGVHPAVLSYLEIRKENFFKVENTPDGRAFVTARAWKDLSDIIKLYERCSVETDQNLFGQYLQDKEISEDFGDYFELWCRYRSDYRIPEILAGKASEEIKKRASDAPFDEQLSLLGLLKDNVFSDIRQVIETEDTLKELHDILAGVRDGAALGDELGAEKEKISKAEKRGALPPNLHRRFDFIIGFLTESLDRRFEDTRSSFGKQVSAMKERAADAGEKLSNLFNFCEEVWPEGQELLILVTDLTATVYTARFIARYGSREYYRHNEELMFYERQTEIIKELKQLDMGL